MEYITEDPLEAWKRRAASKGGVKFSDSQHHDSNTTPLHIHAFDSTGKKVSSFNTLKKKEVILTERELTIIEKVKSIMTTEELAEATDYGAKRGGEYDWQNNGSSKSSSLSGMQKPKTLYTVQHNKTGKATTDKLGKPQTFTNTLDAVKHRKSIGGDTTHSIVKITESVSGKLTEEILSEEYINEILLEVSSDTLVSYKSKAGKSVSDMDKEADEKFASGDIKSGSKLTEKGSKRYKSIITATRKELDPEYKKLQKIQREHLEETGELLSLSDISETTAATPSHNVTSDKTPISWGSSKIGRVEKMSGVKNTALSKIISKIKKEE